MPHSAPSCPSALVAANPLVRALAPRERRGRGHEAEQAAVAHYTALGYRVLAQNWRYRRFEVDLILADSSGGTWIAAEVKFQSRLTDFAPWNRPQLHRIQRAAAAFGRQNHHQGSWRIDLVRCHGSPAVVVDVREAGWPNV
ncbi:MAG: YraN family protein, partial [Schleiferiaceae bacterium]